MWCLWLGLVDLLGRTKYGVVARNLGQWYDNGLYLVLTDLAPVEPAVD